MPTRDEVPRIVGIVLAKSPKLVLKLSWRYLKAKKKAQRAEAEFRKSLTGQGMDPAMVDRLTELYISTISVRALMKEFGLPAIRSKKDNGSKR
ncbi:MAG: hypothetical protein GWN18_05690 [Thermoplasmata archaeon]|nr:hypothetical protein [Thermoplasmata archaeon]NIS11541.1 hypothetical protein [Thermoplasmata archaeon]NIS19460.1 hypothetical protein [Thermoplasmata archaeon]NIT76585.1 hypothetical protein [Thermoplasmata archaeon]NIU48577.1 hypothetical protein [Thermoplasmata archaeon]